MVAQPVGADNAAFAACLASDVGQSTKMKSEKTVLVGFLVGIAVTSLVAVSLRNVGHECWVTSFSQRK